MPGFAIRGPSIPIQAAATAAVSGAASAVAGQSVPNWTGTPSPTIYEGIAGNYTLPVTGLVGNVAWSQPGAKPAWLSFSGNVLSWTSAAAQQTISGVVLRATNAAGTSDSAAFALTVNAAPSSTGFLAGFTLSTRQFSASNPGDNDEGITLANKQTRFAPHPNGRMFMFGGDQVNSGTQQQWSVDSSRWVDGSRPSAWKLVMPNDPAPGFKTHSGRDCSAVCWDTKRRVFWSLGGYDIRYAAVWQDTGKYFLNVVAKFDPTKPLGQGYTPTSAATNGTWHEAYGRGLYDPVLDLCVSSLYAGYYPTLQWFDPATEQWIGFTKIDAPGCDFGTSYSNGVDFHIDPVQRKLWVEIVDDATYRTNATLRKIVEISLPNSRAEMPSGGATVNWAARATIRYTNPNNRRFYEGPREVLEVNGARKIIRYLVGPQGVDTDGSNGGGMATLGIVGRPEWNNGTPNTNTAVAIDIDTGAEELLQLPLPKYADGQGWIIPNVTSWNQKQGILMWGTMAFETSSAGVNIEPKMQIARRKPVPSWMRNDPLYAWREIPGSTCSTMTGEARNVWTGAESGGGSACRLGVYQNPFNFSIGALRQADATLLFHGGGGGDGEGNGVLGFVCNAEMPYWTLPMAPTPRSLTQDADKRSQPPYSSMTPSEVAAIFSQEFNHTFADPTVLSIRNGQKSPTAVHAYGSTVFLQEQDTWLRFGTQMVHPTDQGLGFGVHGFRWSETAKPYDSRMWLIDYATIPSRGNIPEGPAAIEHPWTSDVLYCNDGQAHLWRHASNTWQQRVDGWQLPDVIYNPAVIDPQANVALCPARPWQSMHPRLIDLDAGTTSVGSLGTSWVGPAVDSGEWLTSSQMGYTWDDDNQCVWCVKADYYSDASFDLYKLTLQSKVGCIWRVEKVTTSVASGSTRPSFTGTSASYGRTVRWSRELGGLLVNVGYDKPIYFIKTSTKV